MLDYNLKTIEERVACVVDEISNPETDLNAKYKGYIADYLLFHSEKNQTKREKETDYPITTRNREITINKRQVSYEQIVSSLENGEDGIYALINEDKNQLLDHKATISQEDEDNAQIKELLSQIETLRESFERSNGQRRYSLKKQIIETYQQIYILKASGSSKPKPNQQIKTIARMSIPEKIIVYPDKAPKVESPVSLLNPAHVSFLLCYYSILKQETYEDLNSDMHWLLIDLEDLVDRTLKDKYPVLYSLLEYKVDGLSNEEIKNVMEEEHNIYHNEQYYSTL